MNYERLFDNLESLEDMLTNFSTGSSDYYTNDDYTMLRSKTLNKIEELDPSLVRYIPDILKKHRNLDTFWNYIKNKYRHYSDRRTYIHEEFSNILYEIERRISAKQTNIIDSENINKYKLSKDIEKIKRLIENGYYDSAITASRTLVQTTEKIILQKLTGQAQNINLDADELHSATMKLLNLDPSRDYDKRLKQIITGLNKANSGLAQTRNVASDAHTPKYKAEKHHAELAANTAITICEFLIGTFEYQNMKNGIKRKENNGI